MTLHVPHVVPVSYAHAAPSRLASHIVTDPAKASGCHVAIVGLPDDLGVRLNNGRQGAAGGPRAVRDVLSRYGVADPAGFEWPHVFDAGDVRPADGSDEHALHETHRRVSEAASVLARAGMIPVAIGGGHDLTFPFVRGCMNGLGASTSAPWSGLYVDAHLDVRETVGSGMPFRRLIEDCGVRNLRVVGLNPLVNSREHVRYFSTRGNTVWPAQSAALDALPTEPCFVSIDLDGLDSAPAPGVSAPNPCGLAPAVVSDLCLAAGASPHVRCFDIMELSPAFDVDNRTARLAAHLLLSFLRGVADRLTT